MSETQEQPEENSEIPKGWTKEGWEIAKTILVSLAIVLPIRYYIVQPFIVRGASMEPNFENREYLIINEVSYYFREPKRGEVIVFRYPRDPQQYFIKRIIGLPGEKIAIKNGLVTVFNGSYPGGFTLEESYLDQDNSRTQPDMEVKLGSDEFFVLGDNRDFSSDSRVWGPLPKKLIVGKTALRAWPVAKAGLVPDFAKEY